MSGLTGTGLARVLRHHRPDLPIVLVSGYSGAMLTHDALAAGVSELLTKPLQSREIATTRALVSCTHGLATRGCTVDAPCPQAPELAAWALARRRRRGKSKIRIRCLSGVERFAPPPRRPL
jgi:CheY-like chemotaxis protein